MEMVNTKDFIVGLTFGIAFALCIFMIYDIYTFEPQQPLPSEQHLISTMQDVANAHEYNVSVYNCRHYSNELYYRLYSDGYNVSLVGGYYIEPETNQSIAHRWVHISDIYIEATSGTIIIPDTYDKYYVEDAVSTKATNEAVELWRATPYK